MKLDKWHRDELKKMFEAWLKEYTASPKDVELSEAFMGGVEALLERQERDVNFVPNPRIRDGYEVERGEDEHGQLWTVRRVKDYVGEGSESIGKNAVDAFLARVRDVAAEAGLPLVFVREG